MLKKCIVIMVMFTLIAGAAFAQITFGGQLQEGMVLFSGSNVKDSDMNMGGEYTGDGPYHEAKFSVLFGDGTAGGRLVFNTKGSMWGWMQWRPNQYFRVKIGSDGDGEGGFPQIVGWGFTGEAKNSVAAVSDYNGSLSMSSRNNGLNYGAFDGGVDQFHLMLSVWPIDMLQINVLFRNIDKEMEITERLARMQLFASYKIEEIGTVRFAMVGNGGLAKEKDDYDVAKNPAGKDVGTLWLGFYSNELLQGLAWEFGMNFNLPRMDAWVTNFDNMNIAAGINLSMFDPFNLKVRTNFALGGQEVVSKKDADLKVIKKLVRDKDWNEIEVDDVESKNRPAKWGIGLLPSYKFAKLTVFLHVGMGFEFDKQEEKTDENGDKYIYTFTDYDWFINPYIWMPMGGMRMWVGLQILDAHKSIDGQIDWKIPFGFNFYF